MRIILALGLLISLCASADAATAHHARTRAPVIVGPSQAVIPSGQVAVPGWSDEDTRRWMDNASSGWSHAGG